MTNEDVKNYRYWVDENNNIWLREAWCMEPTVTFKMLDRGPTLPEVRMSGAIGCLLLSALKPLTTVKDEV